MSEKTTLVLTVTVEYELNGESPEYLSELLYKAATHLAGEGMLSGSSGANVCTWLADVKEVKRGLHLPSLWRGLLRSH